MGRGAEEGIIICAMEGDDECGENVDEEKVDGSDRRSGLYTQSGCGGETSFGSGGC